MRAIMASLGLSTQGAKGYEAQFGLTVKSSLHAIQGDTSHALMAASPATLEIADSAGTAQVSLAAPPLVQPTTTTTEDDVMGMSGSKWLSSVALGVAVSATSVVTAQATPSHAIGECEIANTIPIGADAPGVNIRPTYAANDYMWQYQNQSNSLLKKYVSDKYSFDKAATKILVAPKHGKLILDPTAAPNISATEEGWYVYVSDKGFTGDDTFVMQVEKYGLKINVHYKIAVPEGGEDTYGRCTEGEWKISQIDIEDANGVQLVSTLFKPEDPFQPASLSAYLASARNRVRAPYSYGSHGLTPG